MKQTNALDTKGARSGRPCTLPTFRASRKIATSVSSALLAMTMSFSATSAEPELTIIHSFNGSDGQPGGLEVGLAQGPGGTLVGITTLGGRSNEGTFFYVDSSDQFHHLRSFSSRGHGGTQPNNIFFSESGEIFGTTAFGGKYDVGTVFKILPFLGPHTVFSFNGTNGNQPSGHTFVRDDAVYGTTGSSGGGKGNVYRLASNGAFSSIYEAPYFEPESAGLYWGISGDSSGMLYGASMGEDFGNYHGTVFKLDPQTGARTILHTFTGGTDGSRPTSPPVVMPDGTIYGTTNMGGTQLNLGTIYKVSATGDYSVVYRFTNEDSGGAAHPFGGLVLGKNGNLYGTASAAIYEFSPVNGYRLLKLLVDSNGVNYLQSGLLETAPGIFYGLSSGDGANHLGTVYRFDLN